MMNDIGCFDFFEASKRSNGAEYQLRYYEKRNHMLNGTEKGVEKQQFDWENIRNVNHDAVVVDEQIKMHTISFTRVRNANSILNTIKSCEKSSSLDHVISSMVIPW